jgi:hypothetical protein
MCFDSFAHGIQLLPKDTINISDDSFEAQVIYTARDSILIDAKNSIIYLYGGAKVEYEGINLVAGFIQLDLEKNEVESSYIYDKDSNIIERPIFKDNGQEVEASKLRYNFDTKKAFIEEVKLKQDEMFLHMEVAKRQQNGDIHFEEGRFTTCELDDPHYHFQLSRAVMIPEKRIVSGPMNLWIKGVPTPLGLPFSVIPQSKTRKKGILFPEIVPYSQFGFGFQNLGFYVPINDNLQNTSYLTLYNRGSFELKNEMDYLKRYKHTGTLGLSFLFLRQGFPSNEAAKAFKINWTHQQDRKSNPKNGFSARVNFNSQNNPKNSLNPNNDQYLNNILRSDINFTRNISNQINSGIKLSMDQNNSSGIINLTSPIVNFNTTRFYPLKIIGDDTKIQKAIAKTNVTYTFEGKNNSTFRDSLLMNGEFGAIQNQFINGTKQTFLIQNTFSLLKNTVKAIPSLSYNNYLNFQQIRKEYDATNDTTFVKQLNQIGGANNLSFALNLNTTLYSYYAFIGKKKPLLRHIATPSMGYSYTPNLNSLITSNAGEGEKAITYSAFEKSQYTVSQTRAVSLITFGLLNTFELKTINPKDTVTGFKKTKIIESLSFTGNYNILKDSMNLSNIDINLRLSPIEALKIVLKSDFSPYSWDESGKTIKYYALDSMQKLGRIIRTSINTNYTFTSKESKQKLEQTEKQIENNWNADYNYFLLHPEQIVSFDIPWKVTLAHIYILAVNQNISANNSNRFTKTHTLNVNGDISLTKRWKFSGNMNFDLHNKSISYSSLTLNRDMHCWALSFNWIPLGFNKSFVLSIRNTSSLLKDAKIDLRKPPLFF